MNKSSCLIDQERDLRTHPVIVYLHADCWVVRNGNVSKPLQLLLALVFMIVPLQTHRLSHPSLWTLVCNGLVYTDFFSYNLLSSLLTEYLSSQLLFTGTCTASISEDQPRR